MRYKMSFDEVLIEFYNRKWGFKRPIGGFKSNGLWLPSKQEHQTCCEKILERDITNPLELHNHCCTLEHICNLYNIDYEKIKSYQKRIEEVKYGYIIK